MVTTDFMPTVLDMLSISHVLHRPIDGMSIKGAIDGAISERTKPIGFLFREKMSWMTHQYKLISIDDGMTFELYDLLNDPEEQYNIATENEELVEKMKEDLFDWINSVDNSRSGGDY
jgi:arylsulfatase A-like enzyme